MSSTPLVRPDDKLVVSESEKAKPSEDERLARARAIAVQHALGIEEKKNVQNKVLDMILTAFDLPSSSLADPANPSHADVITFRQCLAIFRPVDLDELVSERNIDDRCGYALCPRPNLKQPLAKVWDATGRLVEKKSDGQWCSKECKARNTFARKQLSSEPAWLRSEHAQPVALFMDGPQPPAEIPEVIVSPVDGGHHHQQELAEKRGPAMSEGTDIITIIEKEETQAPKPPSVIDSDILDGLPVRTLGLARKHG